MAKVETANDNALAFLKADLGYFDSVIPAPLETYLKGLLDTAVERITKIHGIVLELGNASDDQFVAAYAAWLYRDKEGKGKPESLKQEIKDRQVHKVTSQ